MQKQRSLFREFLFHTTKLQRTVAENMIESKILVCSLQSQRKMEPWGVIQGRLPGGGS